MTDRKSLGPIDVKMGNNNSIGHIGHNITYVAPPPDPNSIYQSGQVVGVMGSISHQTDGKYEFEKLFIDGPFDKSSEFKIQEVRLIIEQIAAETTTSFGGRPATSTLWNVICRVL